MCANLPPFFSRASSTTELLQLSSPVNLSQSKAGRERSRGGSELFTRRAFHKYIYTTVFPLSLCAKNLTRAPAHARASAAEPARDHNLPSLRGGAKLRNF